MAEKKQLGQILLEAGVIDEFQLKSALGYQKQWGGRLGKVLVENRFITEDALLKAVNSQTKIPIIRISEANIPDYLIKLVPLELAERHNIVPVKLEGETGKPSETLVLAMSEPTDLNALDEVRFKSGKRVKPVLATESGIKKAIGKFYKGEEIEADFVQDPDSIQFAGPEIAVDDMQVVQGRLEAAEKNDTGQAKDSAEPEDNDADPDDPFAELESLAREPQSEQQSSPAERVIEPEVSQIDSGNSVDIDIDLDAAVPASEPDSSEPEESLPEVEILEELEPVSEEESAPVPRADDVAAQSTAEASDEQAPTPSATKDKDVFGLSGELLGSQMGHEPNVQGEASESRTKPDAVPAQQSRQEPPADPEPEEVAASEALKVSQEQAATGSSGAGAPEAQAGRKAASDQQAKVTGEGAMEALLSRVGVGVDGQTKAGKADETPPLPSADGQPADPGTGAAREAVEEKPDAAAIAPMAEELDAEVQRLIDRIATADSDQELPRVMKSSNMIAAVVRLLLKKELISETEFLEELKKR